MICLTPKTSWSTIYKAKENFLQKKYILRKKRSRGLNKNQNEGFLTAVAMAIKKDPTTPIRTHTNELKVHKNIKQDLSPDLNLLDYAIWGILENKTNATSQPNIGLLLRRNGIKCLKNYFEGMQIVLMTC